jgi:hypothetical protein
MKITFVVPGHDDTEETHEPPTFGPFYIGLGTGGNFLAENGTLAQIEEVSGQGYERFMIGRDNSVDGWELRGDTVQSPTIRFNNTDPLADWTPVDFAFLTLSQQGTLGNTTLIAAVEFPNSVEVGPQSEFRFIFRFRQITTGLDNNRVNYAVGALLGGAGVVASAEVL